MTQIKRFVVIGETGAGKSAFINAMYNYYFGTRNVDEVFNLKTKSGIKLAIPCKGWDDLVSETSQSSERDVNDQTKSQTTRTTSYSLKVNENLVLELIDTPGFNDTTGVSNDVTNLEQIEKALRSVDYLNGIIIVANGSVVRIGTSFQYFLSLLREIWPNSLTDNVCVVLTNCDEISCNLDFTILQQLFKVNSERIFHIQNNLFAWDRKSNSGKTFQRFRGNFEDTIDEINDLVEVLLTKFENVSTEAFSKISIQQPLIEKHIQELITRMISLIGTYKHQANIETSINNAKKTMDDNKQWDIQHEITAIKWMEVPRDPELEEISSATEKLTAENVLHSIASFTGKLLNKIKKSHKQCSDSPTALNNKSEAECNCITCPNNTPESASNPPKLATKQNRDVQHIYKANEVKVQLTLPDNVAISHHKDADEQVQTLSNELETVGKEQEDLRNELDMLLEQLKSDVQQIREINAHVDLIDRNKDLLTKFQKEINETTDALGIKLYFDTTIGILKSPSSGASLPADGEQMETDI
ncbi:unnamed protein product [Adineta ricciae]|uniref:G domain-containing protein n=1 Tax=Adineta ricciae TaxID=249248 RepID=A0A814TVK7_ADIRI|nr:unnamed protein product [Adineta ricciae]CAF1165174.1 unnamed protein product [Adineta ricciae]